MKKLFTALVLGAAIAAPVLAADVGVSVSISQPGVYGRVDIGRFPQPQVVLAQPVVIVRPVRVVEQQPVYLWVPPGHRQDWRRYCGQYNACGTPVYFVRDDWYGQNVQPHKQKSKQKDKHKDKHDRDDDRGRSDEQGRDGNRGHGNGHGKRD